MNKLITAAVAGAAALAVSVGLAAPAPAAARYTTYLSVNASPEPVTAGGTVTVAGHLKYKKQGVLTAPTPKTLTVYFDPAGSKGPVRIRTVRTSSTGAYAFKHSQSQSGTWIVKYAGASNLTSDRATDYVAARYPTRLTVNASPEPVAIGGTVTVAGHLKYTKHGRLIAPTPKTVSVYFDPAGSAGAVRVGSVRTTSSGAYSFKHSQSRSGTWIVKYAGASNLTSDRASDYVEAYERGPWNYPGRDLDCSDVRMRVWVGANDYHRLDADGDGWGCDSYAP
ncbi:hypothetical protein CLV28_1436 [Sediminihabitans luteus]|uniref:Excalibur calcium-binding domain-containing protein n=1 Tax=Sediminihabitans luteus TaxID=1138585 RepID=A0A2M9CPW1_9CELL|nr:hypothetical protein [Sediminihabitans luteus]PJJ73952.1 hypothetical protein CLV28_1436 [Sediminihabitans luteus]GII98135.1 hypothetical protein Slu03_05130 [Sediminihabitans luteus]